MNVTDPATPMETVRRTMRVIDPDAPLEFVQVGPGLTPAFFQLPELKPMRDWRPHISRTLTWQAQRSARFAAAMEGIDALNAEADLCGKANESCHDALPFPTATTKDRPHLWRGMSAPDEGPGIWINPCSPIARTVAQYGHECRDILKGRHKA